MKRILLVSFAAIRVLCAQAPPHFEVATIKPAADPSGPQMMEASKSTFFTAKNATLRRLVSFAYGVPENQTTGGPAWMDKEAFDIVAQCAPPPPEDPNDRKVLEAAKLRFQTMVAELLKERFQLQAHREMREMPSYRLEVSRRGLKLKESDGLKDLRQNAGSLVGRAVTLDELARILAGQLKRPVVNRAGSDKAYDFTLSYAPDLTLGAPGGDRPSLFTALEEQLGLRLETDRVQAEMLVVDSAQHPTEN